MINPKPYELDHSTNSLVLRRKVRTSPERLFEAWTHPDQVSKWWDPSGQSLVDCMIDLREGGNFRFVNAGAEQHPFVGRYTAIEHPSRIAFDAMGADCSVRFEREGDATVMTVSITCGSSEQLEQFAKMGIANDTARTLDNLVTFLENEQ